MMMLAAFAAHNGAGAEQNQQSASFAPVPQPTYVNPQFYTPPAYDIGKFDLSKLGKEAPPPAFDSVDLGKSVLRFDLVDNTMTRPDAPDLSDVIIPLRPGKKRATPRYFGMTFVTPTQ